LADLSRDNLERLQQRDVEDERASEAPTGTLSQGEANCPHSLLVPRWDAIEDMGKMSKVVGYRCDACGRTLSREQGAAAIEHGATVMGG
jgi:hypothetical protein